MTSPSPNQAPDFKTARITRGWSLREAAKKLGLAYTYLYDLEEGSRNMTEAIAGRMYEVYGLYPHVHEWACECGAKK